MNIKHNRKTILTVGCALLVLISFSLRFYSIPIDGMTRTLRTAIYIFLYSIWAFSIQTRIIHNQIRKILLMIAFLMIMWFLIRNEKYIYALTFPNLARYLWYLYYLPMLLIPSFAVMIAKSIGLSYDEKLESKSKWIVLVALLLFVMVMTNDFHQLVFTFPDDSVVYSDSAYGYGFGYLLIVLFLLYCGITTIYTLYKNSRLLNRNAAIIVPILPIVVLMIYTLLICLKNHLVLFLAGDSTAVICLLYSLTLELCIQKGFIGSNNGYVELFMDSSLPSMLVNKDKKIVLSNNNSIKLDDQQIHNAIEKPLLLDDKTLIQCHNIEFGYLLWQQDVKELLDTIEDIEDSYSQLQLKTKIDQQNLITRQNIISLQQKNRITDLLNQKTSTQIEKIDLLLKKYDLENNKEKKKKILIETIFLASYIKRYGNFLLVSQQEKYSSSNDLVRCFQETFSSLQLLGVDCHFSIDFELQLETRSMIDVYHSFQLIVEQGFGNIDCIWVKAINQPAKVKLIVEIVSSQELSDCQNSIESFDRQDNNYRFTYLIEKGSDI